MNIYAEIAEKKGRICDDWYYCIKIELASEVYFTLNLPCHQYAKICDYLSGYEVYGEDARNLDPLLKDLLIEICNKINGNNNETKG